MATLTLERAPLPTTGRGAAGSAEAAEVAMAACVLAGILHLWVAPEHLEEAWWLGTFFLGLGVGQLVLAVLLLRPLPTWLLVAAVAGTAAVVALYVASRTMSLGFMPGHGFEHLPVAGGHGNGIPVHPGDHIEEVGSVDLLCLVAELVTMAMMLALMPVRARARTEWLLVVVALIGASVVLRT